MKKQSLMVTALLSMVLAANAQVKVNSVGDVKIGRTDLSPLAKLDVEGSVRFNDWTDVLIHKGAASDGTGNPWGGWVMRPEVSGGLDLGTETFKLWDVYTNYLYYTNMYKTSDSLSKDNIQPLSGMLSKLNQLGTYSYQYKPEFSPSFLKERMAKGQQAATTEYGVLAQEVYEVFPHLVSKPDSGMMAVDYTGLIPILLQSIKEQQVQIGSLQYKVQQLEREANLTATENELTVEATHLDQNYPNPFNAKTTISYFVAQSVKTADIMIFDMAGTFIRKYKNIEKGKNSIDIEAKELGAGMYMYSLIADGVEIDSKKMILSK